MKQIIRIEELAITIGALYLLSKLDISIAWWLYPILFLAPDISIAGYALGNEVGAVCYDIFHHKAIAIAVIFIGVFTGNHYVIMAGLMLLAHSSFDRIMGFGLKYFDSFQHTHLGMMGKKPQ